MAPSRKLPVISRCEVARILSGVLGAEVSLVDLSADLLRRR
jgi:hypothetical protein